MSETKQNASSNVARTSSAHGPNGCGIVVHKGAATIAAYPHIRVVGPFVYLSGFSSRRPDNTHRGAVPVQESTSTTTPSSTTVGTKSIGTPTPHGHSGGGGSTSGGGGGSTSGGGGGDGASGGAGNVGAGQKPDTVSMHEVRLGQASRYPCGVVGGTPAGAEREYNGHMLSIAEQTHGVMHNLRSTLAVVGLSLDHVVDIIVFLVNMDDYGAMNRVYNGYFPSKIGGPTRTCVAVHQLPHPNLLIEIKAVAYCGDQTVLRLPEVGLKRGRHNDDKQDSVGAQVKRVKQ